MQKRFIADAAHQMRTPLAGMRMQSELALRQTDGGEIHRSLEQLAKSSQAATRLVNQLLALARAEHQPAEEIAAERVGADGRGADLHDRMTLARQALGDVLVANAGGILQRTQVDDAFVEMAKMAMKREATQQIIMPDSIGGASGALKLQPNSKRGQT